ncbi:M28 family peptidase [Romeria aff. gracilis LEGE 07310]|uniref:M28 family peptidase n=1 Tax=Vasconcelosia minhoensis LEGE 07310 TaxID=915328 RepID=A0A8J7AE65_9CYAN|nr:M28 family peptidase [Romeria gracilis]MBE9075733.1 M28 family peptidase [Romeria aff. gracilis LEGE 07310]
MRRSFWLLAWGIAIAVVLLWGKPLANPNRLLGAASFASMPRPVVKVDAERLMADVSAIAVPRQTADARAAARAYLVRQLIEAGWVPQLQPYENGDTGDTGVNLIATRPGSRTGAGSILVGAHYDSVADSPGADDNASGVAAVLEIARLLANQPTPRTLQIALFDQEEEGLVGSLAYTAAADLSQLRGVVILEMLGYACNTPGCQKLPARLPLPNRPDKGNFLAVIGLREQSNLIDAFRRAALPVMTLPVPTSALRFVPDLLRSDHAPFWQAEVGAVMVTDTANFRNPHYHQPSDTVDTLDPSFFAKATQTAADAVVTLLMEN